MLMKCSTFRTTIRLKQRASWAGRGDFLWRLHRDNCAAALRVAHDLDENALVVFIGLRHGSKHYLSKFHSDEWMKEKRLLEPQKITAGLILRNERRALRRRSGRWSGRLNGWPPRSLR